MESVKDFYSNLSFGDIDDEIKWKKWEVKNKGLLFYVIDAITKNCGRGSSILDVGGGTGANLLFYGDAINSRELHCLDIREPPRRINGINYITAPVEKLTDISTGPYDCIIMTEVIEHLYDPDRTLEEALKKLVPNGILVITTPNLAGFLNVFSLLLGFQPVDTEVSTVHPYAKPFTKDGTCVGHIRVFTLKAMKEMLISHGLDLISLKSIGRTLPQDGSVKIKFVFYLDRFFARVSSRGGTRMLAVCKKKDGGT